MAKIFCTPCRWFPLCKKEYGVTSKDTICKDYEKMGKLKCTGCAYEAYCKKEGDLLARCSGYEKESHNPADWYKEDWASIPKQTAKTRIDALKSRVDSIMAAGERGARRYEDAGPLDIASEKAEPLEMEIEILQAVIKGGNPPKKVLDNVKFLREHKKELEEYKNRRQEEAAKHQDLMGKTVEFKNGGQVLRGTVVKIISGKWGGARLKLDNGWTIGVDSVKKILRSSIKEKQDTKSLKGKQVTWLERRTGEEETGKVLNVGSSKVKVHIKGDDPGRNWRVPFSMIIKVNGRPWKLMK